MHSVVSVRELSISGPSNYTLDSVELQLNFVGMSHASPFRLLLCLDATCFTQNACIGGNVKFKFFFFFFFYSWEVLLTDRTGKNFSCMHQLPLSQSLAFNHSLAGRARPHNSAMQHTAHGCLAHTTWSTKHNLAIASIVLDYQFITNLKCRTNARHFWVSTGDLSKSQLHSSLQ